MSTLTAKIEATADSLSTTFLLDYPRKAAQHLEAMEADASAKLLQTQPPHVLTNIWPQLVPGAADSIFHQLDTAQQLQLLQWLDATVATTQLSRLPEELQQQLLTQIEQEQPGLAQELRELLSYNEDCAGRLMSTRVQSLREDLTVAQALRQLKQRGLKSITNIYLLNEDQAITGIVESADLLLAESHSPLSSIARPVHLFVQALTPKDEVLEILEGSRSSSLPVLDANDKLIGQINASDMYQRTKEDLVSNMQTMVGVSKDEKALSSSWFSVRKRLPWLQINLLTAFAAAAVVGVFEGLISEVTALAILLPVAAGQSGNAGAQALAVTMRGLTLREITLRHWLRVATKELRTGMINGMAIAVTCSLGVWLWSHSTGLALVIALAMVISLMIACTAGALVPIALKKLGQDPAQSSSIVLTTITDIAGFFSFLGIATLLADMLPKG